MPRPKKCRNINCHHSAYFFKPRGIPMSQLETINLFKDELEAIRLADSEGLHHSQGAALMGVSRATFGRILAKARQKIANGIINGMAIKIEAENSNHIKLTI